MWRCVFFTKFIGIGDFVSFLRLLSGLESAFAIFVTPFGFELFNNKGPFYVKFDFMHLTFPVKIPVH